MKSFIASVAFAAGALIAAGSALAADVRVSGVPYGLHRGVFNFACSIPGQSQTFVIPMNGFGPVVQALRVEQAAHNGESINFFGNCSHLIQYHGQNEGTDFRSH